MQLLTESAAAQKLGLSLSALSWWMSEGALPFVKIPSKRKKSVRMISLDSLKAFDANHPLRPGCVNRRQAALTTQLPLVPVTYGILKNRPHLVGFKEAASLCGVHRGTILTWVNRGKLAVEEIPTNGCVGKAKRPYLRLILRTSLMAMMDAKRRGWEDPGTAEV